MGKSGGALSAWIKEFCTLVFIQTIQAFTYAIIVVVIVQLDFNLIPEQNTRMGALGIFSIIAFVSVFKIEELLRKIFGVSSTRADRKSMMQSLGKLAVVGHFGKRLLNNVGKITGGAKSKLKSRQDLKKLNDEQQKDLEALKKDMANKGVNISSSNGMSGDLGSSIEDDTIEALEQVSKGSKGPSSSAYNQRLRSIEKEYESKRKEIEKARQEGTKQIIKGFTETGGAIIGGTTGALVGISDGDVDGILTEMVAGAGIGDALGEKTVDTISSLKKSVSDIKNAKSTWNKEMQRFNNIKKELSDLQETLNRQNVDGM